MSDIFDYEKIKGLYNNNFDVKGGSNTSKINKNTKKVKIPKKVMKELYEKINVMYKLYNKKNKTMKGGNNGFIPDDILNLNDLQLRNFLPTPYEPTSLFPVSLSKFA